MVTNNNLIARSFEDISSTRRGQGSHAVLDNYRIIKLQNEKKNKQTNRRIITSKETSRRITSTGQDLAGNPGMINSVAIKFFRAFTFPKIIFRKSNKAMTCSENTGSLHHTLQCSTWFPTHSLQSPLPVQDMLCMLAWTWDGTICCGCDSRIRPWNYGAIWVVWEQGETRWDQDVCVSSWPESPRFTELEKLAMPPVNLCRIRCPSHVSGKFDPYTPSPTHDMIKWRQKLMRQARLLVLAWKFLIPEYFTYMHYDSVALKSPDLGNSNRKIICTWHKVATTCIDHHSRGIHVILCVNFSLGVSVSWNSYQIPIQPMRYFNLQFWTLRQAQAIRPRPHPIPMPNRGRSAEIDLSHEFPPEQREAQVDQAQPTSADEHEMILWGVELSKQSVHLCLAVLL